MDQPAGLHEPIRVAVRNVGDGEDLIGGDGGAGLNGGVPKNAERERTGVPHGAERVGQG